AAGTPGGCRPRLTRSARGVEALRTSESPTTVPLDGELHPMRRRVLVVDAGAALLEVREMRLAAMGFDVTATPEANKAMEFAATHRFDVALLDLRMLPLDGIQLMEALHQRQPRLPVLIMTAHGTIETAVEA